MDFNSGVGLLTDSWELPDFGFLRGSPGLWGGWLHSLVLLCTCPQNLPPALWGNTCQGCMGLQGGLLLWLLPDSTVLL